MQAMANRFKDGMKALGKALSIMLPKKTVDFEKKMDIPNADQPVVCPYIPIDIFLPDEKTKSIALNKKVTIRKYHSQRKNWSKWKKRL
ncbi:hypothetical protein [Niallia sp. 03190]|uniref:hypothetical protein n=1 Tax=Niallia sp. 03190 TaxID=3458061 RepID=UPI004044675F